MVFNLAGSDYAQISTLKSLLIRLADLPVDSPFMDAEVGEARRRRKRPGEKQEKLLQVANNAKEILVDCCCFIRTEQHFQQKMALKTFLYGQLVCTRLPSGFGKSGV